VGSQQLTTSVMARPMKLSYMQQIRTSNKSVENVVKFKYFGRNATD
jgi:hypothetical protein